MNRFLSIIIFLFLSPLFMGIMILIFLDDGFPIFFKQKRVGVNNKIFFIYKFRTMKNNSPDMPTHMLKDPSLYYTKYGKFLRKFSLDELPQLINIFKMEMVFIGPRPALHNQKDLIKKRTEKEVQILPPGITGWAQINGRDELEIDEKVEMDYYYLKNQSLSLDIRILFLTFIKAIKADGVYS